jgi:hypothetical protein
MNVLQPGERRAAIESRKDAVGRTDRRWVRGQFRDFPIYQVPVEFLILNADNRRFRAERLRWEEDLGRPLDPQASESDERSIISILLDDGHRIADDEIVGKASKDSQALTRDWQLRGQEQPLWIRPDGWVINGNRRLAALKRMALDQGTATGTFSYVEALILGWDEIDDNELFEMEAREQLTEGFKVRYGDLNTLLTLREAAVRNEIVWTDDNSIENVAHRIQDLARNNAGYAAVQLRAIRYMDEFLDYIEQPGAYQRLIGQVERFRDIAKNMHTILREMPDQALDFLILQFQAVQAELGHLDIRELRKLVIEEPENFEALVTEVQEIVDTATPEDFQAEPLPDDDPDDDADEDDEIDGEAPAPSSNFPRRDVKRSLAIAIENRQSRKKNDTETALRSAASRLEQVTPERLTELLAQPKHAVATALQQIRDWVESVRDVG